MSDQKMKIITYAKYGGVEELFIGDAVKPTAPAELECIVKIVAAGVNPVDYKRRKGYLSLLLKQTPFLGFDFSGTIVEIGSKVTAYKLGDSVYGREF
jgi:2-methylene-furan-3-one reductase